jgi:hypothetical protein
MMMQVLDAVKSAIPDAVNRPAGEVLEHVLGALRNCPGLFFGQSAYRIGTASSAQSGSGFWKRHANNIPVIVERIK